MNEIMQISHLKSTFSLFFAWHWKGTPCNAPGGANSSLWEKKPYDDRFFQRQVGRKAQKKRLLSSRRFQFVKKVAFKEINQREKLQKLSAGVLLRKQQNKMKSVLLAGHVPAKAHREAPNVRAWQVRCRGRIFDQNP